MIDALLYAVRDYVRSTGIYGRVECDIMEDGKPPPRAGNVFVAVHSGKSGGGADNNLDERFGFSVTLTMRVTIPLDRVGDQLIARNIELVPLGQRQGFNARVEQLRAMLHMNWRITVLTGQIPPSANDNLSVWAVSGTVYGFVEPARYKGQDGPARLVGGDWFAAEPDATDFGIAQELRFDSARRVQPQMLPVGPFV